ncbi:MAG: ABC transporter permease [Anaerolineaceae bacterium]|nr:ABC transporter permease [Anaerolineaceae bacterium]MCY3906759.1 ABC transporter permease [Anaerolineaceae bacterium]
MSGRLEAKVAPLQRVTPVRIALLLISLVMLLAWAVLPWIHQPELGPTLARVIAAERSANELDIQRQGLSLPPIAALVALGVAFWSILSPQLSRALALVMLVAGLLGLVYHVTFFVDLAESGRNGLLSSMGTGFWLTLLAGVALMAQFALPRKVVPGHEINKVLGHQESVLALGILALIIVVGLLNPRYVADRNISEILQGNAYIAVAAIGVSMVIISGNIDISVGSLIGVLGIISGAMVVAGYPVWLSWLTPLVLGALVGSLIGFLVAWLRIPSIIVTLGMLSILKGGLLIFTNAEWITGMPTEYALSQQKPLGIPMGVYIMLLLTLIAAWWLRNSATGRAIYAVGGNAEAARLSGISERRIIMSVFIINGVFIGIASVMFATQLQVIQATVPPNLELVIITASVVGGVSILGGTGTVIGSTLAAILLNTIRSAMVFINVSPFWLQAVQGVLILATVLVDILRRRRQLT